MKNKTILFSLVALIACSCHFETHGEYDGAWYSESFIDGYLIPQEIRISDSTKNEFRFEGIYLSGEAKEKIKKKYGDTTYKSMLVSPNDGIVTDFHRIEITSNIDFDSEHKAGELLNDIAMFHGKSAWKFIQAGSPKEQEDILYRYGYWPIDKLASEITGEDLILLHPDFSIQFAKQPENPGTYLINIAFIGDGITIEKDMEMTFGND